MMSEKEYTYDERPWPDGPWMSEPDKVQWHDPITKLNCLAVRHPQNGHWCGYVGVEPGHPDHGVPYQQVDDIYRVHGGLTYSAACEQRVEEGVGVCHVPGPGESENIWWFGFDCMHAWDVSPGFEERMRSVDERVREAMGTGFIALPEYAQFRRTYKDLNYVQIECTDLAHQLADRAKA